MSTQYPKKRKTSRPISPATPRQSATELDTVPERRTLLRKLEKRLRQTAGLDKLKYIENPPDQEKMSEVLKKFIKPYTRFATDTPSYERLIATALVA